MASEINVHIPLQGDLSHTTYSAGSGPVTKGIAVVKEMVDGSRVDSVMEFLPTVRALVKKPDNFEIFANQYMDDGFTGNYVRTLEYHFSFGIDGNSSVSILNGGSITHPVFVKVSDGITHFIAYVNVDAGSPSTGRWVFIQRASEPDVPVDEDYPMYASKVEYGYEMTDGTHVDFLTETDLISGIKYPKDVGTDTYMGLDYVADAQDNVLLMQCMRVSDNVGITVSFDASSGDNISFWYVSDTSWYKYSKKGGVDGNGSDSTVTSTVDGGRVTLALNDTVKYISDIRVYNDATFDSDVMTLEPSFGFYQRAHDADIGLAGNRLNNSLTVFNRDTDMPADLVTRTVDAEEIRIRSDKGHVLAVALNSANTATITNTDPEGAIAFGIGGSADVMILSNNDVTINKKLNISTLASPGEFQIFTDGIIAPVMSLSNNDVTINRKLNITHFEDTLVDGKKSQTSGIEIGQTSLTSNSRNLEYPSGAPFTSDILRITNRDNEAVSIETDIDTDTDIVTSTIGVQGTLNVRDTLHISDHSSVYALGLDDDSTITNQLNFDIRETNMLTFSHTVDNFEPYDEISSSVQIHKDTTIDGKLNVQGDTTIDGQLKVANNILLETAVDDAAPSSILQLKTNVIGTKDGIDVHGNGLFELQQTKTMTRFISWEGGLTEHGAPIDPLQRFEISGKDVLTLENSGARVEGTLNVDTKEPLNNLNATDASTIDRYHLTLTTNHLLARYKQIGIAFDPQTNAGPSDVRTPAAAIAYLGETFRDYVMSTKEFGVLEVIPIELSDLQQNVHTIYCHNTIIQCFVFM